MLFLFIIFPRGPDAQWPDVEWRDVEVDEVDVGKELIDDSSSPHHGEKQKTNTCTGKKEPCTNHINVPDE